MESPISGYSDGTDIYLNIEKDAYSLITILFHELRHIHQPYYNLKELSLPQRNLTTQITEADARVCEVMGCYEIHMAKATSIPLEILQDEYPEITPILKLAHKLSYPQLMKTLFLATLSKNKEKIEFYKKFIHQCPTPAKKSYTIKDVIKDTCKLPKGYQTKTLRDNYIASKETSDLLKLNAFCLSHQRS